MFGNKYEGDTLAKEFFKLMEHKKMASEGADSHSLSPENHVEDPVLDPAEFLQSLDEAPEIAQELDEKIDKLDSMHADQMYSDDMSYLLDHRAAEVLSGLGKIAGSLRNKGEMFSADMVEATATSIQSDLIKEASKKLQTINALKKVASDISESGDSFTADIVNATISKIKNN